MPVELISVVVEGDSIKVPDVVLTLSSPVFAAMLETNMKEAGHRLIELPGKSKAEFEVFLQFLDPASQHKETITQSNVDFLVKLSDEYQVESLKERCEQYLMTQEVTVDRLLQAHRHGIKRQRERCIEAVGEHFDTAPMERVLQEAGELMSELMPYMQKSKKKAVFGVEWAEMRGRHQARLEEEERKQSQLQAEERRRQEREEQLFQQVDQAFCDLESDKRMLCQSSSDFFERHLRGRKALLVQQMREVMDGT